MRRALAGHRGIRDLTIKGDGDLVEVTYAADETSVAIICQQVMETVLLPGLRNLLGRLSTPSS